MCGIFGCINFKDKDISKFRLALNSMIHRGPDQWGDWYNDSVYFGHRRLSIIDLSEEGKQPFYTDDVVVSVNGEIYNFKELKKELTNVKFKSNSDSEVILHGYLQWGIKGLLDKIDGMYAFAIYDIRNKVTYLAKDRWGKKPLFYTLNRNEFIFASEIKAILKYDPTLAVFSSSGIRHWINYRGSHHSSTIFSNISRISPGSFLKIDHDLNLSEIKYYDLLDVAIKNHHIDYTAGDLQDKVDALLQESVNKRLISDVPLGLQLSGGVDSSLLAYYLKKAGKENLHTFSVVFNEDEYKSYSEEKFSTYVSQKWGFTHHSFGITQNMIGESFEKVVWLFDGMLDYPNAIPLYLLSKYSKEHITVSLTGEAADELFGGYRKYVQAESMKTSLGWYKLLPPFLFNLSFKRTIAKGLIRQMYIGKYYRNEDDYLNDFNSYISSSTLDEIWGKNDNRILNAFNETVLSGFDFKRKLLLIDHLTYLYSLLERQDRTSMGASIEARLPFIDRKLVETMVSVNPDLLFSGKQTKIPLKKLSEAIYGPDFTYRQKMGFPMPIQKWLSDGDCLKKNLNHVFDNQFVLFEKVSRMKVKQLLDSTSFDNKLLNYSDSERIWLSWFLMVLRSAQDIFGINDIRE